LYVDFEDVDSCAALDAYEKPILALLGNSPETTYMRTVIGNLVGGVISRLPSDLITRQKSPELNLIQVMRTCTTVQTFGRLQRKAETLVHLLGEDSDRLTNESLKLFKKFAKKVISVFESSKSLHGVELTLEKRKCHNEFFLKDLEHCSSYHFSAKDVKESDLGLFLRLNVHGKHKIGYQYEINVARLAKALSCDTCASLMVTSGNQRLTLLPQEYNSTVVVLHIAGIHEILYMNEYGCLESRVYVQIREGLTFDLESLCPVIPTSSGRLGPGISQAILSSLASLGVSYGSLTAAIGFSFCLDAKSGDTSDRDSDNCRIVTASERSREQDDQSMEDVDFFYRSIPGLSGPYKYILRQVVDSLGFTRSTGAVLN
jgi:RNase P subunit RPR2